MVHLRRRLRAADVARGRREAAADRLRRDQLDHARRAGSQLWPLLLDHRRLEIAFAHRTIAWGSDARGKAHVHVVIVGLDAADHAPRDRRLFAYEDINGEPLEGATL